MTRYCLLLGCAYSASHSEYIRGDHDGELYFLETSSRVGGANIAELVEASSGVNLWREWAKLEVAMAKKEHMYPLLIPRSMPV